VKAPLWKRWWMIGLGLIVVSSAVYLLLRFRVQKVRREQEWKSGLERQLLVLESKALRSQMNPHFIFNVMNSIQDFILKNDMKSAQKYLTKFARLVRMILDNSVQSEVLLDEELKANRLYIELEQQRFNRKFDFDFEIEEGLEDSGIRIPSMLIQPFLENAVKHGISHLEGQGYLRLSVKKNEADLLIEIQDNGVGRKAAAEWNAMHQKDHHSMGSMLTEKRVEILNATLHAGIRLEVEDLMSQDGRPAGTLVRMVFPTLVGD
jgi:LytS/YehU family sensor histidine kinase